MCGHLSRSFRGSHGSSADAPLTLSVSVIFPRPPPPLHITPHRSRGCHLRYFSFRMFPFHIRVYFIPSFMSLDIRQCILSSVQGFRPFSYPLGGAPARISVISPTFVFFSHPRIVSFPASAATPRCPPPPPPFPAFASLPLLPDSQVIPTPGRPPPSSGCP